MLANDMSTSSSLSEYFGFDPKSPYANLFSQIYDLTKPNQVWIGEDEGKIEEHEEGEAEDEPQESALNLSKENLDSFDRDSDNVKRLNLSKECVQWDQTNLQNHNSLSENNASPFLYNPPPLSTSQLKSLSSMMSLPMAISSPMLPVSQPPPFLHLPPLQFPPSLGFAPLNVPPPTIPWSNRPFLLDLPHQQNLLTPQQSVSNSIPPQLYADNESKGFDLKLLFEFDTNPERATWILKYLNSMASVGTPLTKCPSMHKEPLDLFKLYHIVISEGGFDKCSSNKTWKKISLKMTKNYKPSFLWRILQKQYRKYLLHYEKYSH